jgi:hypothetical protein
MSKPKRRGRVSATQGLVEGIMQAVATFNAEMGLEAPRMPHDGPTTSGPIERPTRLRKSKATGPTDA